MEDLIRRSDAVAAAQRTDVGGIRLEDVCAVTNAVADAIKALPTIEPRTEVIAQVTFDEEKLRGIVKEAVERFKEEYEIADRPQGEWIDRAISIIDDMQREGIVDYQQAWEYRMRARMKGADDETN